MVFHKVMHTFCGEYLKNCRSFQRFCRLLNQKDDALKVQFSDSRVVMKMGTSQTLRRKVIMWSWTANHAVAIITLTDYWWLHVPQTMSGERKMGTGWGKDPTCAISRGFKDMKYRVFFFSLVSP